MSREIEILERRIADLLKERDEYDARRREAIEKLEEYRAECLEWREWMGIIAIKYNGVTRLDRPVHLIMPWDQVAIDNPWPSKERKKI